MNFGQLIEYYHISKVEMEELKKELSESKAEALILDKALTDACIVIDIYQLSKGKNEELKDIKKRLIEEARKCD